MRLLSRTIQLTRGRRLEVYREVADLSAPRPSFYVMVAISATIAAYGLLAGSAAVVIGAMLVAPLMGPIFGIALGLAIGDRRLLGKALLGEVLGILMAVAVGAAIGLLPLRLEFGPEILARTQPTIYDIIVALVSGLAGAYAIVDERISPAMPGVAVAVAVVPPLATCGLCLAAARWDWALGALLLFVANFLAIEIASALVFAVFGMVEVSTRERVTTGDFLRRFGVSLLALAVVGIFMTRTLVGLVTERRFAQKLQAALAQEVTSTPGAKLADWTRERKDGRLRVIATVFTPAEFQPHQVARMQVALRSDVSPDLDLIVRSLLSKDSDEHGPVFLAEEEVKRREEAEMQSRFLGQATDVLDRHLAALPGAQLGDVRWERVAGEELVTAEVHTPEAVDPAQVAAIQAEVERVTGYSVRLIVRSLLTRDADADRYLYQPEAVAPKPLTGEALALHKRLERALTNQLTTRAPGAVLTEFRYRRHDGRLALLAVVQTPVALGAEQVAAMQTMLRRYVGPGVDLVVRWTMGADTGSEGYVSGAAEDALVAQPGAASGR